MLHYTCNSPIIVDNFSILGSTDNNADLRILESLFIHKQKPVLNEAQSAFPLCIVNRQLQFLFYVTLIFVVQVAILFSFTIQVFLVFVSFRLVMSIYVMLVLLSLIDIHLHSLVMGPETLQEIIKNDSINDFCLAFCC